MRFDCFRETIMGFYCTILSLIYVFPQHRRRESNRETLCYSEKRRWLKLLQAACMEKKRKEKKPNITDRWIFLAFSSLLWITLCYTVLLLYLLPVLSYLVMRYQYPFWCGNVFRHVFGFHCMRKCTSGMRAHGKWELPKTNISMWGLAVLNKLTRNAMWQTVRDRYSLSSKVISFLFLMHCTLDPLCMWFICSSF